MHYRTFFTVALLSLVPLTSCGNSLEFAASSAATTTTAPSAQIVFARRMEGMNSDLFIMDDAGNQLRQITDTPLMEMYPAWSPDGSRLAFTYLNSEENGLGGFVGQVFIMRADGSERVGYTNGDANVIARGFYPSWSPDGSLTYLGSPDNRIWAIDPATAAVQPVTPQRPEGWTRPYPAPSVATDDQGTPDWSKIPTQYQGAFDWSPDGSSFVTSLFGNIAQVHADGMSMRWLTEPGGERDREGFPQPGSDSDPVWSPDGTQIAFVRHSGNSVSTPADIFVMNADGSNVRQLTTTPAIDNTPRWSPDGKRIVFASKGVPPLPVPTDTTSSADAELLNQEQQFKTANDIFVINVDGSGLTNLTNSPEHETMPDWRP